MDVRSNSTRHRWWLVVVLKQENVQYHTVKYTASMQRNTVPHENIPSRVARYLPEGLHSSLSIRAFPNSEEP